MRWLRVPDVEFISGRIRHALNAVAAGGPGLVAVGNVSGQAAVLTSTDGLTWSRVPHDRTVFGEYDERWTGLGGHVMKSVTAGGPGLVAVGSVGPFDDSDAAVWTSPDGFSRLRVPHDDTVFGGDGAQRMASVAAGGPGLVAVGTTTPQRPDRASPVDAAVWTSPDGFSWLRVPHDDTVFGGDGARMMSSAVVGGPGLVAVGTSSSNAAVWTSPDGFSWSKVPHDDDVFSGSGEPFMASVTLGGPGLVAVGYEELEREYPLLEISHAAVWTSLDGIVWSKVPHDDMVFGGDSQRSMESVTAGGPGLVAVGHDSRGPGPLEMLAAVWTSPDGVSWTRVPHNDAVFGPGLKGFVYMTGVTVGGPGLVAVGYPGPAVWVTQTED